MAFQIEKKQTNADRIRHMSDEELAQEIYECCELDLYYEKGLSFEWWLDWLKQEVSDD